MSPKVDLGWIQSIYIALVNYSSFNMSYYIIIWKRCQILSTSKLTLILIEEDYNFLSNTAVTQHFISHSDWFESLFIW